MMQSISEVGVGVPEVKQSIPEVGRSTLEMKQSISDADRELALDNNISERELRRDAVGRKNWLFVGNDDAGEINATFVTLIASSPSTLNSAGQWSQTCWHRG